MADYYLDISAIGNEYQDYADTPTTWAVPQDGNGKAGPGHAAAVAIATIDCASASASGAGVLGVLGVTVSSTLTGSGATLATNIVTAINASATPTIATYSALLLPLNRLVFARVNPGVSAEVQIMLRIAGTDWNGMLPVTSGTWGTTPTMGAFAGGADGPFGYFTNPVAVFGKTAHIGYGVFTTKAAAVSDPVDGPIYIRSMRSGVNLNATNTSTSATYFGIVQTRNFIVDHGTKWAGDDGVFSHVMQATGSNAQFSYVPPETYPNALRFDGGRSRGAIVSFETNQTQNSSFTIGPVANDRKCFASFKNIVLTEIAARTTTAGVVAVNRWVTGSQILFDACEFNYTVNSAKISCNGNSSQDSQVLFNACKFSWVGIGSNASGMISEWNTNNKLNLRYIDCEFSVDGGTRSLVNPIALGSIMTRALGSVVSFENCRGISNPSAGLPVTAPINPSGLMFLWDGSDAGRSFRVETNCFTNEWVDDGSFPTLTATNQALRPICNRISMRTLGISPQMPIQVARYNTFYKGAAASKTLTIQVLTDTAQPPTYAHIHPVLKYTDSTEVVRFQALSESWSRQVAGTATALPVSSATWSLNGVTGYEPRKLVFVTDYPVKTNSELTIELWLGGPPASDSYLYINPEIEVS